MTQHPRCTGFAASGACLAADRLPVQVFYPFVLAYLVAGYLQGGVGAGSSGPLTNLRQYLWVPIFQTAYR